MFGSKFLNPHKFAKEEIGVGSFYLLQVMWQNSWEIAVSFLSSTFGIHDISFHGTKYFKGRVSNWLIAFEIIILKVLSLCYESVCSQIYQPVSTHRCKAEQLKIEYVQGNIEILSQLNQQEEVSWVKLFMKHVWFLSSSLHLPIFIHPKDPFTLASLTS